MADDAIPPYSDEVSHERLVPDPLLTLSECVNAHAALSVFIDEFRPDGDAVIDTVMERLRMSAEQHAKQYPEQMRAVRTEIDMQSRLSRPLERRRGIIHND